MGGEICKIVCNKGIIIKMTQNVCGMGCFLAKKTHVLKSYLLKVREKCGIGALSVTPFTEKIVWSRQKVCGMGVYPR